MAPSGQPHSQQLQIDRRQQNDQFSTWKLGREFLAARAPPVRLAEPVTMTDTGDVNDYLHTRSSVLHNHAQQSEGRVLFFSRSSHAASEQHLHPAVPTTSLWEVHPCPSASPPVLVSKLAGAPC
jgi:hypothetical protein